MYNNLAGLLALSIGSAALVSVRPLAGAFFVVLPFPP
nr:MAG TPA: hypothetical protein [Caudoviricetes sp.]